MGELLSKINFPSDLKKLNLDELERLAEEIRDEIMNVVSINGGHLASNLGVVELTIAIHYVFNAPHDKVIFDVGHQSYTHKLLTGRKALFKTLRRYQGISGFTKRTESIFDPYGAGHSSTSISAGLGLVEALRLKGDDSKVIAVIGDGSMTAGLAFEGLNLSGHLKKDIIVILNDNEMSISSNVGALSSFLSRKLTGKFFVKLKKDIELFLKSLPSGENMLLVAKRAEEAIKGFLTPGMLFEAFGFSYVGPINGHRIKDLLETFENIKDIKKPIFIHVLTQKGRGYPIAEKNPSKFHGIGPFDIKTGKGIEENNKPSYTEVFGKTLLRLARENNRIVAITAAMCDGTGLDNFAKEFPDRLYDVGIAEQHAITFAAGLATEGFIPVAAIYSTFLQRAYDQIVHDICLQKLPVVIAIDRSGIVGSDGATHQGIFDYSYLRHIPNIIVMAPKDENELQHMLNTAVYAKSPISIRYPRGSGIGIPLDEDLKIIDIGKGEVLREGKDVLILAIGFSVYEGLRAAKELEKEGIECSVINARFVKPMDKDLICSFSKKIGRVITVEENVVQGGFGSAVLELFAESGLNDIRIKNIGIPDIFVEHGSQDILRNKYNIDYIGIIRAIKDILNERKFG